ncbi:MAG: hypothetical protein WDN69_29930 [Aliidongia sp.]
MTLLCPCCGAAAAPAGHKAGRFARRDFQLARCADCGFGFVADPLADLAAVYDEAYYRGSGADPLVDYLGELDRPAGSIRLYEWRGILQVVETLRGPVTGLRWLDYGCGNGGLVRLRARDAGRGDQRVRARLDCGPRPRRRYSSPG